MTTQMMKALPSMMLASAGLTLDDLTLEQIKDLINDLSRQGSTFQYQIGAMYNHVVSKKLAELAGFKDALTYFSQHVKALSRSTLLTYGAVARSFSGESCTQYGVYRLRALLRYLEATHAPVPADPGSVLLDVPQDDGLVVQKPLAQCSVDDVERAARAKRAEPPVKVPVADRARLLFLADSIHTRFEGVAQVRFTSSRKEGKTFISLQDVPMTELERLTQALQEGMEGEPTLAPPETHAVA